LTFARAPWEDRPQWHQGPVQGPSGTILSIPAKEAAKPEPRVALVAGASGLTGSALVRRLLREDGFSRVLALSRRPLPLEHARLANRILKFDELERSLRTQRCTDAFCALGAAGGPRADEAQLREVDLRLVLAFARAALACGASRLVVVSAAGADRKSANAFLRVKGEMEAELRQLPVPCLEILQPGVVYGTRGTEGLAATLRHGLLAVASPLLRRSTKTLSAISGEELAAAMTAVARSQRRGAFVSAGETLAGLAGSVTRPSR
jgi:uncharacterized protein YbjT (DUF2867 family)